MTCLCVEYDVKLWPQSTNSPLSQSCCLKISLSSLSFTVFTIFISVSTSSNTVLLPSCHHCPVFRHNYSPRLHSTVVWKCQNCRCCCTDDIACGPVTIKPSGRQVHWLAGSFTQHRHRLLADGVAAACSSDADADCGVGGPPGQVSPVLATVRGDGRQPWTLNCVMQQWTEDIGSNCPWFPTYTRRSQLHRCFIFFI